MARPSSQPVRGAALGVGLVLLGGMLCSAASANAGDTTTNSLPAAVAEVLSGDLPRLRLRLEEQLQSVQLAQEHGRQEAEAAARRNAELLDARLRLLEHALIGERARELDSLEQSQRLMLVFAGVFAGAGLLTVLASAHLQLRAVSRLAANPPTPQAALVQTVAPSPMAVPQSSSSGDLVAAQGRLVSVIERLEQRMVELEQGMRAVVPAATVNVVTGNATTQPEAGAGGAAIRTNTARKTAQIDLLLGKGETLLELDRAEEALACFDEALRLDPHHPEVLLKKGAALERARMPDEALACYDRVIAGDRSATVAYLQKGGLCNRLERFDEALQCYEQALKAQEQER